VTRLATHLGASVDVLYVATAEQLDEARGSMGAPRYVDQPHHEWSNWTREMRERLAIECAGCSPSAQIGIHLRRGDPAAEIVHLAKEGTYDAIALVRRSRMEPGRARTLREVIRTAPCPLFVIGGGQ
jgi:nucleotide-binding universal stress UspA family protein